MIQSLLLKRNRTRPPMLSWTAAFLAVFVASDLRADDLVPIRDPSTRPPNVLFIGVDDLNDWIEPLGGHPDVLTPNLNRLAQRGIIFTNAHCQAPLCNSSRCSLMTSLRPSTTGIYGLAPFFRDTDAWRTRISLNQFFRRQGYTTYSAGKIYHATHGRNEEEFDHIGPVGLPRKFPPQRLVTPAPIGNNPWVDWGLFEHQESEKTDYDVASWCVEQIDQAPRDKPWLIACGFFQPHVPCYPPPQYWNQYSHDRLALPLIDPNDRLDCSPFAWLTHWYHPEPRLAWLKKHDHHRNFVHSYLACITFVDAQVGRLLDALDASAQRDNTIICLWSDHGYHLGEKNMTGKTTLWERSTHVPLMFAGPNIPENVKCDSPAELLDIFPTLAELVGARMPDGLEGVSLVPQIESPSRVRSRPAITDHNPGNQSIRDQRYRLIHYADGSEELYDLLDDPGEQTNLIGDAQHNQIADRLRQSLRTDMAPLIAGSKSRVLEKRKDGWYWQGERIDPDHPPMDISPHTPADLPR
ncbi:MAG: sulfatase [Planctomycetota bacterium]